MITRREFLRGLGLVGGAAISHPLIEAILPDEELILIPERKIWAVGAQLQSPKAVVFPQIREHTMIISQYINTTEGRAKLAASMVQPLRRRVEYSKVARGMFSVETLPAAWEYKI